MNKTCIEISDRPFAYGGEHTVHKNKTLDQVVKFPHITAIFRKLIAQAWQSDEYEEAAMDLELLDKYNIAHIPTTITQSPVLISHSGLRILKPTYAMTQPFISNYKPITLGQIQTDPNIQKQVLDIWEKADAMEKVEKRRPDLLGMATFMELSRLPFVEYLDPQLHNLIIYEGQVTPCDTRLFNLDNPNHPIQTYITRQVKELQTGAIAAAFMHLGILDGHQFQSIPSKISKALVGTYAHKLIYSNS